ncbi:manganese-dependent inorganic pyrophosphatase [Desulfolithobacter dissulfuricans]|uniref:inorganic diphosphatase n=1 Tax=Desulfolithobacter dissulfuricans TaxID=2795293 RepID=A0A915UAQ5_9BACT|nr:manganese-dependent inorganic pyrophosphatase [Desulfolithobacter dissulfuricans]BCO09830.1 manganese-dependent inorganic pyrophosphatase [Desulfolithobacter dissulfuricans]
MSVYVVGHKNPDTDSVTAAIAYAELMKAKGEDFIPVVQGELNPETVVVLERFGVAVPETMTDAAGKKVALVDHSDLAQAPDNLGDGEVVAIVDHHKIGDVTTNNPIFCCVKPVGCTGTVLTQLYNIEGVAIDPKVAGLMLAAILSDTVNFKSPTCTDEDKQAVEELKKIAGVEDTDGLFMDMLKAKSGVEGVPAKDLLNRDYKDFDMNGNKVGCGQLELATLDQVADIREDLLNAMKEQKAAGGHHTILLMLTDVVKEGTDLLVVSDDPALIEKAFGTKLEGDSMWIEGMMSRKKQTIPNLQKAFGC